MILSREQAAAKEFLNTSRILGDMLVDDDTPEISAAYTNFIHAVASYGQQELFARQAERADTLDIHTQKQKHASKMSQWYRERGDRSIGYALDDLGRMLERGLSDKLEIDEDHKDVFEKLHEDLRFQSSELEIKPQDMTKLDNVFQEVIRETTLGGPRGLVTFMHKKLEELRYVRNQPNRGAVDNIPFWKVIAIAIAVGMAIWLAVRCVAAWIQGKRCNFLVTAGQAVVIVFATMMALFC